MSETVDSKIKKLVEEITYECHQCSGGACGGCYMDETEAAKLIKKLKSRNWVVRLEAIDALGKAGDPAT